MFLDRKIKHVNFHTLQNEYTKNSYINNNAYIITIWRYFQEEKNEKIAIPVVLLTVILIIFIFFCLNISLKYKVAVWPLTDYLKFFKFIRINYIFILFTDSLLTKQYHFLKKICEKIIQQCKI